MRLRIALCLAFSSLLTAASSAATGGAMQSSAQHIAARVSVSVINYPRTQLRIACGTFPAGKAPGLGVRPLMSAVAPASGELVVVPLTVGSKTAYIGCWPTTTAKPGFIESKSVRFVSVPYPGQTPPSPGMPLERRPHSRRRQVEGRGQGRPVVRIDAEIDRISYRRDHVLALLAVLVAAAVPVRGGAAPAVNYHLARSFALGGEGGWDYLSYDPASKRLFISRGTRVMVVDPAAGTVVAEISDTPGVHGIAFGQDVGKGFTSNGRDNSVSVFDLKTLKTTGKIALDAKNPDAIVYEPVSKRVFTGNGGSANVTAIDAVTNAVVGNVALPGRPEFAAAGNGMVYFNIEDKNEVVAIDPRKNAIVNTWPLGTCDGPSGLSMDVAHHRLFSGCGNNVMMVVNSDSGAIVAALPIGKGTDATAFDPGAQLAFSSNGDGTLTVAHEDSPSAFAVVQNATTQAGARTLAVDTGTHDVYLVAAQFTLGTPAPGQTRPTRTIVPGSVTVLVMSNRP